MSKLLREIDKLVVFVTVAEKGKINEAADALHLSQPAISRSIQKLEEAFEAELFVRGRAGVKLTPAGTLLFERASRMLRELEDVRVRARNLGDDLAGNVTVGTYESLAEYLWPEFLVELERLHPNLRLSISTSPRRNPLEDLDAGRIDLLVDAEPQTAHHFTSWPLYSDYFAFYVSPTRKISTISPAAAGGSPIVYVRGAFDEKGLAIENHLERAGYRFGREFLFDSFSTAKHLARIGAGIAVLPRRLAQDDEKRKLLRRIPAEGFDAAGFGKHSIYATVSAANEKDPRVRKLVTLLKGHFKS